MESLNAIDLSCFHHYFAGNIRIGLSGLTRLKGRFGGSSLHSQQSPLCMPLPRSDLGLAWPPGHNFAARQVCPMQNAQIEFKSYVCPINLARISAAWVGSDHRLEL